MRIGVDFDNTIVCYHTLFHRVAYEQGLIPRELPQDKNSVRDYLRQTGQEPRWTELQGRVYGQRLNEAEAYPGFVEFLRACRDAGAEVCIISHKTQYPYLGERYDLHAAARSWLDQQGFGSPPEPLVDRRAVFFELSQEEKLSRIRQQGCSDFIDDLPEFLMLPDFPADTRRFLFDPGDAYRDWPVAPRLRSWAEAVAHFFP